MRSPQFSPICPSPSHTTSFARATDPTLHRQRWQSPIARPEEHRLPARKIPSRFRSLLRYDALSTASPAVRKETPTPTPHTSATTRLPPRTSEQRDQAENGGGPGWDGQVISTNETNLDELTWFQHRWLDKHGKNSHMKESREKMVLLRRWFESLDADGSGEVGLNELEDPLVSVGLARSRDEVQRLIDQVDKDGSGEVTFTAFLRMMNPEQPKRSRQPRLPLHHAKPRPPPTPPPSQPLVCPETPSSVRRPGSTVAQGSSRRKSLLKAPATSSANPVVKLFEDMQSGKLGDLAIPFPVLITAYRRRMLLNAHMADDPTARRLGSSVLQALESTRQDDRGRRRSSAKTPSPSTLSSSYLKSYMATTESPSSSYLKSNMATTETPASLQTTQLPTL